MKEGGVLEGAGLLDADVEVVVYICNLVTHQLLLLSKDSFYVLTKIHFCFFFFSFFFSPFDSPGFLNRP